MACIYLGYVLYNREISERGICDARNVSKYPENSKLVIHAVLEISFDIYVVDSP